MQIWKSSPIDGLSPHASSVSQVCEDWIFEFFVSLACRFLSKISTRFTMCVLDPCSIAAKKQVSQDGHFSFSFSREKTRSSRTRKDEQHREKT